MKMPQCLCLVYNARPHVDVSKPHGVLDTRSLVCAKVSRRSFRRDLPLLRASYCQQSMPRINALHAGKSPSPLLCQGWTSHADNAAD